MTLEEKMKLAKTTISKRTQLVLANDTNSSVRYHLAQNPNIVPEAQFRLANDENWDVRYWLATNPNTTDEVLLKLMADGHEEVRKTAIDNMKSRIK